MEPQPDSMDRPVADRLKATYRALLARGLEAGEAANLTAFMHGLPSAGLRWTLPEIESIVIRRLSHAAELRAATEAAPPTAGRPAPGPLRPARATSRIRRHRSGATRVIDPPNR
jgi:hypothetical protein